MGMAELGGAQGSFFGSTNQGELDMLAKALDSGYDVGGATQTDGDAWKLESLEKTLALLTARDEHIQFYKALPKPPARATAIEYARRTSVGTRGGGWLASGELPPSHDASYDRSVALVKYLGDVREIKMPFLLVDTLVDQRAETTASGTQWVMETLERALFKGNAKLGVAGAEFEEIDGLETYISRDADAANTINLWGSPLEEGNIRNAGQVVIAARGHANKMFAPVQVLEDYSAAYLKHQYIPQPNNSGGMTMGMEVNKLKTVGGTYSLNPIFMYEGLTMETPPTAAAALAPSPDPAPVITGLVAAGTGLWGNSLGLTAAGAGSSGTVAYQVGYGNKYGESIPVVSVAATQAILFAQMTNTVRLTITNPAGFVNAPTYAAIYRRDTNADGDISAWGCVARVALTSAVPGAVGLVWDDTGVNMPGTYRAWLGEMTPDVCHLSQLLPFTRIALPALSLAERFALVMFVSFIMRIPNRWVEFRNIGRRTV